MIEKILFYSGIKETFTLRAICTLYATELRDGGVFHPEVPHGADDVDRLLYRPNTLNMESPVSEVIARLHKIKRDAEAVGARTLVLGISTFRPKYIYLRDLAIACRAVFPGARQRLTVDCSCRDDILLEMVCNSCCLLFDSSSLDEDIAVRSTFWPQHYPFGADLRNILTFFGREAVFCGDTHALIDDLQQYAELPIDSTHLPPEPRLLRREVLHFIAAINPLFAHSSGTYSPKWTTQLTHLLQDGDYAASPCSLLGPKRRSDFLAACAKANKEAAHLLGRKSLFSPPEPEPNWEPLSGLSADTAFAVARRLDRDFAQTLLEKLDTTPEYYFDRDLHVARRALHDALGHSYLAPPLFLRPEPKLTVLTLTYNHEPFIARNIESILAQQTSFPIRHIIADDASDDATQEIILDYASKHPSIIPMFRKKNSGGPENVRALFDMARSEYVALCDGDDYFSDPTKLQTQVDYLDANKNCSLCFHVVRVTYENAPERERLYPPVEELPRGIRPFYYLSDLIRCNIIQTNSVMYRWRFRNGLPNWFRADLCPGDWYWHLLHAENGKIGFINKVMSVYHRHQGGIYYLSETDRLKHRMLVGMQEIQTYDVINRHFNARYESILLDLINGVFADSLLYDTYRAEEDGSSPILAKLCERYPDFARHFLQSLKSVSHAPAKNDAETLPRRPNR